MSTESSPQQLASSETMGRNPNHSDGERRTPASEVGSLSPRKRQWEQAFLSQDPKRIAHRFLNHLFHSSTHCNWCFERKRIPYDDYDEARINEKSKNRSSINSWSLDYETRDDGTLAVITATSGPDPNTYHDVIDGRPKKMHVDDDRWEVPDGYSHNPRPKEPPRPKTICGNCARIDIDPTEDRDDREMVTAIRNIVDAAKDTGLPVNERAAVGLTKRLRKEPSMQGKDRVVLERSLAFGIEKAIDADEGFDD